MLTVSSYGRRAIRYLSSDLILRLWKVDLPCNNALESTLQSLKFDGMEELSPIYEMLEVFGSAAQHKRLHIVIQPPPAGELHVGITLTRQMN